MDIVLPISDPDKKYFALYKGSSDIVHSIRAMSRSGCTSPCSIEEEDSINVDKCDSDDDEHVSKSKKNESETKTQQTQESDHLKTSLSSPNKSHDVNSNYSSPPRRSFFITDILSDTHKTQGNLSAFKPLRVPTKYFATQTLSPSEDQFRRGLHLGQFKGNHPHSLDLGQCPESVKSDSEDDDEDGEGNLFKTYMID